VLIDAILNKQEQLVDAQRALGRRGVQVSLDAAAKAFNEERLALPNPSARSNKPMSVCQYREHLTAQSHAAAKERVGGDDDVADDATTE